MKDEENMDDDDDQKDYSESDSDTIRMSSSASETEVWLDQILFSRFTRDLFQVKVEYENMILRNPNVCNLFKENQIKGSLTIYWKKEPLLAHWSFSSGPSDYAMNSSPCLQYSEKKWYSGMEKREKGG